MNKLNYTPRPWVYDEIGWKIIGKGNLVIARLDYEIQKFTPAKYNGRLLAAAPEMLEIIISDLKINLKYMSLGDITFMRQETNSEFNKKIDIVEKATGLKIDEVLS